MKTVSFKELKYRSRQVLEGKHGFFALVTFLMALINMMLSMLLSYSIPVSDGLWNTVLYTACSVLVNIVFFLFLAGLHLIYLRLCRGESFRLNDLFFAFMGHPEQLALIAVLQFIVESSLTWVKDQFLQTGFHTEELSVSLLCYLGVLLLDILLFFIINLLFSMILFVFCDEPWSSAGKLLKDSFHLLQASGGKLFLLGLSFLGLYVFVLLSFGIGILFVQPYFYATLGEYYLSLRSV